MVTSYPAQDPVDICNLALDRIGELPINSIEAPTEPREEIMQRWYDTTRLQLLREYPWNFAQSYRTLSRAGAGTGTYADAYDFPNDFIRLNSVGQYLDFPEKDYAIRDGRLMASLGTTAPIWYNRNITDVSKMDKSFVNLLSIALALNVAYKFTKKRAVYDQMEALYSRELPKAVSVDGQENPPRRVQRSKYLSARKYGYSVNRDNRYYYFD